MSKITSELFVITKAKELSSYILVITDKSPKKFRFTLTSRLQNLSLNVLEYLIKANDVYIGKNANVHQIRLRSEWQQRAITDLKLLSYMSMIAMEQKCILSKQYEQIAKLNTETLALTIRWKQGNKRDL